MVYLKKVTFTESIVPYEKGYNVSFDAPLTFITGRNGAGKSSLLYAIRDALSIKHDAYTTRNFKGKAKVEIQEGVKLFYHDFVTGNKKHSSSFGEDVLAQIAGMRQSTGQSSMIAFSRSIPKGTSNSLILLDEPEHGMHLSNRYRFMEALAQFILLGNQVICTTHSLELLSLQELGEDKVKIYDVSVHQEVTLELYKLTAGSNPLDAILYHFVEKESECD